jgi:hypothetical protein
MGLGFHLNIDTHLFVDPRIKSGEGDLPGLRPDKAKA